MARLIKGVIYSVFLLIGGADMLWNTFGRIVLISTEPKPTAIEISRWETDYHGQRWLQLTGILDSDNGVFRSDHDFVALLPEGHNDNDPVHVVVVGKPNRIRELSGPVTIEGVLELRNGWRLNAILPTYTFAPDVVCLDEGETPDSKEVTVLFGVMGIVAVIAGCLGLRGAIRTYKALKLDTGLLTPVD